LISHNYEQGIVAFVFTISIIHALGLGRTAEGIIQLMQVPVYLRRGIVNTVEVTKEILYRGNPIERLKDLTSHHA